MTARGGRGCLGAVLTPRLERDGPAVNGRVDEEALGKGGGRKRKLDTNEESVGFIGPLRGVSVEFQSVMDGKLGSLPSTSSLPEDDNGG